MHKRTAIEKSRYINNRYKEYLRSSFSFGEEKVQKLFEKQLEAESLFRGPYVDLSLPFQRGGNIKDLMAQGIICKSFAKLGDIDFERPLYFHQEEAIRNIGKGRSAVITTGTGSGKTESFLYPILNELMRDVENHNTDVGIRAIFLYPMNALVNDQIDRVRRILEKCPEITYGFFTGETQEKVASNFREKYAQEQDIVLPRNELVSREEIRENPPHLLFTNYSMLEFLLIRPNDYSIFEPSKLTNWKFVVLDEAHSYQGSFGIEMSLLMRRLTGLAPKKPRFILTSATLGEQNKSEREIVEFARRLTSVEFNEKDIIFSSRIPLSSEKLEYTIVGPDYIALKDAMTDVAKIKEITSKYKITFEMTIKSLLYQLLLGDGNVHHLYAILKNGSRSFRDILEKFEGAIAEEELVALIDLVNLAEFAGIGIFDLKYHSFIRPISGAYITLGKEMQLSLTKTNMIDGYKAFEVGNCRYCRSQYLVGKIQCNNEDNLCYLMQNNEVDVYENYGDNDDVTLDYFLMKNAISEDDVDADILEEYKVCSRCGNIHVAQNLNARKCKCPDTNLVTIYRVKQKISDKGEGVYNNIGQCPCCGHKSRAGIVKTLNLGKDEGTALAAQILFEAIDEGKTKVQKQGKLSLKLNEKSLIPQNEVKSKQFLSFSDSRQQASFSAVFLDATHIRMLRKRLIWKAIEDGAYVDISVDEMVATLASIIKERDVFANDMSAYKNAWITVLVDLLKVDGSYDGEGLGLYCMDLDLSSIMNQLDEADIQEAFGQYGITKSDLETMMQVVFGVFKMTPAINYVKAALTPEEKLQVFEYRRFDNYVMYHCPRMLKGIRSFLPIQSNDNAVVRYVQKVCGCSVEVAKDILEILFQNLAVGGGLFKKHASQEAYQIEASKYIIKNYKTSKYYRCGKCGTLTPHNVHNQCVKDKCDGILMEVDPDEVLGFNYYRKQYKTKNIERIVIKEHTAQLERKKAKQYQQDFKNKKINILSCSTTFEMGIDIGNLETVFLRNVPPSPANYVQRAGRAGRRKDSSAYIMTYCSANSHDYTYFDEPEKMISGVINPPYFNVTNHKIILRHLMSASLGAFFRENPEYFRDIDALVFGDGVEAFKNYMMMQPQELNRYINGKVLPEMEYSRYHDFKWFAENGGTDEKLESFVQTMQNLVEEYQKAKAEAIREEKYVEADRFAKQIEKIHKEKVVSSLSKYCVIPKYGFPVDVVDLQIYNAGKLDHNYDLSRDLRIAISEYAPDSEVVVDGKKYTSQYISLPKTAPLPRYYFSICKQCQKMNVFIGTGNGQDCKYCGESIVNQQAEFYVVPEYGFKTGITKESARMKPKRSYAGEVSYLGGGEKDDNHIEFGNAIAIETSTNDALLVVNKSRFYMCPVCGYSEKIKSGVPTPTMMKIHKNYRQYDCSCQELERIKLGHSFQTDVARITIPMLVAGDRIDFAKAISFLYAFLEGISGAFGIERRDIDGILEMNLDMYSYDILVYDNVPGGAGHTKRLVNPTLFMEAIQKTYDKASQECCDENTACYNCLKNYYNQSHHNKLQRKYAKEVAEQLLRELKVT